MTRLRRARGKGRAKVVGTPQEAVEGADIVVTDTWISMGQAHAETKLAAMMPFQVTEALMARPSRMRSSSTACPRIAARKWSMR
jgi:ornithine carbamoyltransferase